jgi:hypothetical protein
MIKTVCLTAVVEHWINARRNFGASDIGFDGHQRGKESDKEKKVD